MALKDWSTTAASNASAGSINFAEGQAPSTLNNSTRQMMADLKEGLFNVPTDVASAATTDLGAVASNYCNVTGTTTITSFGTVSSGIWKFVKFAGALTLTHNATSLILPTAANITTVAGDTLFAVSEGSGNWRVIVYSRASGAALVGTTTYTTTLTMSGAALNMAKGSDIASAGTADIGAATGNYADITGTTTITALGTVQAGTVRIIQFDGALTLTHNATSLILPGAANITTAAGDVACLVSDGSGNWRCVFYQKASGRAVVESAITIGTAQATTSGTTVDFTSIPAGVKRITIMLNGVSTNGASNLLIQIGDSGGVETSGYVSGASNNAASPSSTAGFILTGTSGAASVHTGKIVLDLYDAAAFTWAASGVVMDTSGTVAGSACSGIKSLSAELDRIRLTSVSGDTFDAGAINIAYES